MISVWIRLIKKQLCYIITNSTNTDKISKPYNISAFDLCLEVSQIGTCFCLVRIGSLPSCISDSHNRIWIYCGTKSSTPRVHQKSVSCFEKKRSISEISKDKWSEIRSSGIDCRINLVLRMFSVASRFQVLCKSSLKLLGDIYIFEQLRRLAEISPRINAANGSWFLLCPCTRVLHSVALNIWTESWWQRHDWPRQKPERPGF